MIFILKIVRSVFPEHALGQSWLTICLPALALCFLVSPYTIDDSCQNYKGNDITEDIEQAITEVREMARNAFFAGHAASFKEGGSSNHLLVSLFGTDSKRHATVVDYFLKISTLSPAKNFVVICDDQGVQWEPDTYQKYPDPLGIWIDHRHKWISGFSEFKPCDPARKSMVSPTPVNTYVANAYTVKNRLIYLCPNILDKPIGRSLASYKDQELIGLQIDDYACLPVSLFHELLHIEIPSLIDAEVQGFPPADAIDTHKTYVYDPLYLSCFPMVKAYGFQMCHKLAMDNHSQAVLNCDSVAYCALGLYLHKNDWGNNPLEGISTSLV